MKILYFIKKKQYFYSSEQVSSNLIQARGWGGVGYVHVI